MTVINHVPMITSPMDLALFITLFAVVIAFSLRNSRRLRSGRPMGSMLSLQFEIETLCP